MKVSAAFRSVIAGIAQVDISSKRRPHRYELDHIAQTFYNHPVGNKKVWLWDGSV